MQKKAQPKPKGNQVMKAFARFHKITLHSAMLKRVKGWVVLETNPDNKEKVAALENALQTAITAHNAAMSILDDLISNGYHPPKKSTSGELKFEHGRKVWIKSKYLDIYTEAYPEEALQKLFVDKVVKGRVVLSVGEPDANNTMTPRIMAPKIHVTGTETQ